MSLPSARLSSESSKRSSSASNMSSSPPPSILPVSEGLSPVFASASSPRTSESPLSRLIESSIEKLSSRSSSEDKSSAAPEDRLKPFSSDTRFNSSNLNFQEEPDLKPRISPFEIISVKSSWGMPSIWAASSSGIKSAIFNRLPWGKNSKSVRVFAERNRFADDLAGYDERFNFFRRRAHAVVFI